jgi:hypothetical protein
VKLLVNEKVHHSEMADSNREKMPNAPRDGRKGGTAFACAHGTKRNDHLPRVKGNFKSNC